MQITSVFKIILKCVGIWLLLNSFYLIPQFFSTVNVTAAYGTDYILQSIGLSMAVLAIYIAGVYFFTFKDDWIIKKLKLDKGFTDNKIDINLDYENAFRSALIIVAGFVLLESAPHAIVELFTYIKAASANLEYDNYSYSIYQILRVVASLLIFTNNKAIAGYLIKRQA